MTAGSHYLLRVVAVLAAVVTAFVLLVDVVPRAEAWAAAGLLRWGGAAVEHQLGTSIQVFPAAHPAFRAVVTPSCSALSSVLALAGLAALLPVSTGRRWRVAVVALLIVVAGNIARIAGSVAVGLVAGRSSLVLFHDWVGTAFAFLYVLGGFLVMLWLMSRRPAAVTP